MRIPSECRHGCDRIYGAVSHDLEKQLVGVVPGVAGGVLRRGFVGAVVVGDHPAWLAGEIGFVALGAMLLVEDRAGEDPHIVEGGRGWRLVGHKKARWCQRRCRVGGNGCGRGVCRLSGYWTGGYRCCDHGG